MTEKTENDLREILIDAHAHFFFLKGECAMRVKLLQILADCIVIARPTAAPLRRTVLGYIPALDGCGVYEIEGAVSTEELPDQKPDTIRIIVNPSRVRRVNRRMYPRVSFTPPLEAAIIAEGEKKAIPAQVINFSAGGLRVETSTQLSPTKKYIFRFAVETDEERHELALPGTIVYELPAGDGFAYGVRFGKQHSAEEPELTDATIDELEQTVDLLGLVNRLLVRGA